MILCMNENQVMILYMNETLMILYMNENQVIQFINDFIHE